MLWTEKYCPKTISEVIGNKDNIKSIQEWLTKFPKKSCSILISGSHGVGKTTTAELILKEAGYTVSYFNMEQILEQAEVDGLEKYIKNIDKQSAVDIFTGVTASKKIAYIVDDIRSISSQKEKSALLSIKKFNEKHKKFPLILICDSQHNKLVNELRKTITEFKFENPDNDDISPLIKKICKNEGLKLDFKDKKDDEDILYYLTEHSQNDIRRMISILQSLKDI